jgi:hypothetical protein
MDSGRVSRLEQRLEGCSLVKLKRSLPSPQDEGVAVLFEAISDGCAKPRYKFSLRQRKPNGSWGSWSTLQRGKSHSVLANPGAGVFRIRAQVKDPGTSWEGARKRRFEWSAPG